MQMDEDELPQLVTEQDLKRLAETHEHFTRAASFAELACESLSPVAGQVERWERFRELMFALKDERDALGSLVR